MRLIHLLICLIAIASTGCIGKLTDTQDVDVEPQLYPSSVTVAGTAYLTSYGGFNVIRNSTDLNHSLYLMQVRRVKAEQIRVMEYYNYTGKQEWVIVFDN